MTELFEVKAIARHMDVSPQKARLVCNEVRGMGVDAALDALRFMPNKSAEFVFKLVQSAAANADENYGLDSEDLVINRIFADDGPRRKSGRFAGRGRFKPLIKRSAHITVYLAEREAVSEGD